MSIYVPETSEECNDIRGGCHAGLADEPPAMDAGSDASDLDLMGSYYAEQQLDDDYIRNVIAPLRHCPSVSAVKVENVRTRTFSFVAGSVVRTDRTRVTVILRGGMVKLDGVGDDLPEAVLAVTRKVALIVDAAAGKAAAQA